VALARLRRTGVHRDSTPQRTTRRDGEAAPAVRSADLTAAMATFLWTLEWSGLTIALLGIGRERWLARRRR